MIIAVDFDDTIMDTKNVPPGKKMGPPIPGAKEALTELCKHHQVFILTASDPVRWDSILEWLDYFDFPYVRITNKKIQADVYIDDKGLHFTDWKTTLEELDGRQ